METVKCFDLEDVFQKQKVDAFLNNPQKHIKKTEVINFGIINEELKGALTEKLRKFAETVSTNDFDNYNTEGKVKAFIKTF